MRHFFPVEAFTRWLVVYSCGLRVSNKQNTSFMKHSFFCAALIAGAFFMSGCEASNQPINPNEQTVFDAQLWPLVNSASHWTYYRHSQALLERGNGSGHPHSHLRTRYNTKAASQLDASGKVLVNPVFPDSSLIIKELINNGIVEAQAVMFKLRTARNAGPGGWIWAEYTAAGNVTVSSLDGARICSDCHSTGIDFTRMNGSHP